MHPLRYVDQCRSVLSLATHTCSMEGHYKDHRQDNTRLIGGTLRGSQGGHSKAQSEDTTRLTWRTLQGLDEGHYKAKREDTTRLGGRILLGSYGGHYKAPGEETTRRTLLTVFHRLRGRTLQGSERGQHPPPPHLHPTTTPTVRSNGTALRVSQKSPLPLELTGLASPRGSRYVVGPPWGCC